MIGFACHVCRTPLTAEDSQAGTLLRCPTCLTTLRAPGASSGASAAATVLASETSADSDLSFERDAIDVGVSGTRSASHAAADSSSSTATTAAPASTSGVSTLNASSPPSKSSGPSSVAADAARGLSRAPSSRRYGFNCAYCSSRLEATGAMAAQEGQCPTCGNTITIPILDRHGRLIDPITRQIIKQDPHPVHAYAAAGDRAPAILRGSDGHQLIRCPRCRGTSPISANNCKACGMPFTMEGTTQEAAGNTNGFCTASLVLGIIGLVTCFAMIAPVLAIIFGLIGYNQATHAGAEGMTGGKGVAVAGMICGGIGCILGVLYLSHNLF